MTELQWQDTLRAEGYSNITTHIDGPDIVYRPHTHENPLVNVILVGQMHFKMGSTTKLLGPDDRINIPAGVEREAEVGSEGCTYISAEKQ